MFTDIKSIWNFRNMVFELTHGELCGKYKGSELSMGIAYGVRAAAGLVRK